MPDIALVTGSSRGLGLEIARALGEAGMAVAVHARIQSDADASARLLCDEGLVAAGFAADLAAGTAACSGLVADVSASLGPVRSLVNNAADQSPTPMGEDQAAAWRKVLEVNLVAAVELTRLVHAAGASSVVNVASIEAHSPLAGHGAYAASKAALLSFTRTAAAELAPLRVNAVLPGLIDRPGLAESWPSGHAWWTRTAPLGRPVTAREVAAGVAFLVSPSASGITGATLAIDAGWSASGHQ